MISAILALLLTAARAVYIILPEEPTLDAQIQSKVPGYQQKSKAWTGANQDSRDVPYLDPSSNSFILNHTFGVENAVFSENRLHSSALDLNSSFAFSITFQFLPAARSSNVDDLAIAVLLVENEQSITHRLVYIEYSPVRSEIRVRLNFPTYIDPLSAPDATFDATSFFEEHVYGIDPQEPEFTKFTAGFIVDFDARYFSSELRYKLPNDTITSPWETSNLRMGPWQLQPDAFANSSILIGTVIADPYLPCPIQVFSAILIAEEVSNTTGVIIAPTPDHFDSIMNVTAEYVYPTSAAAPTTSSSTSVGRGLIFGAVLGATGGTLVLILIAATGYRTVKRARLQKGAADGAAADRRESSGSISISIYGGDGWPKGLHGPLPPHDLRLAYASPFARLAQTSVQLQASLARLRLPPERLPTAALLEKQLCIAEGSFGTVYALRWQGRLVALKVFNFAASHANIWADYSKEVELMAALTHANLTRMIGHGVSEDQQLGFLLMELCEGLSLADWLYPHVHYIVPADCVDIPSHDDPGRNSWAAHVDGFQIAFSGIKALLMTEGRIGRYCALQPDPEPLLSDSKKGQRILQGLEFGSVLAVSDTHSQDGESEDPEEFLTPLSEPILVVTLGPLVFYHPVPSPAELTRVWWGAIEQLPALSFRERLRIAVEAWRACHWIHKGGAGGGTMVHADLKPANILLSAALEARVADVGLAKFVRLHEGDASFTSKPVRYGPIGATPGYVDPAVYAQGTREPRHGVKNDVYSFGVILLELFPDVLDLGMPVPLRRELRDIISSCITAWENRLSSDTLLARLEALYASASSGARSSDDLHIRTQMAFVKDLCS